MPPADQITVTCPGCQARFHWKPRASAVSVKCAKCGSAFIVEPEVERAAPAPLKSKRPTPFDADEGDGADYDLADEPPDASASAPAAAPSPMVDGGSARLESLRSFKRRFRDVNRAADAYAQQLIRLFPRRAALGRCCVCHDQPITEMLEFGWVARIRQSTQFSAWTLLTMWFGWIMLSRRNRVLRFSTFHGFCFPCWLRGRRKRRLAVLGAWLTGLGMLVLSLTIVFSTVDDRKANIGAWMVVMLVMIVLGIVGIVVMLRMTMLPGRLQKLVQHPFAVQRMRAV